MLEQNHLELAKVRLQKSRRCFLTAINDARYGDCESANNRAYYSMYHAIRALLALDGLDFKKHSQTIGYFNKAYVNSGLIEARFNKMVVEASKSRNGSDYDDYYAATLEETEKHIGNAEKLLEAIRQFIAERLKAENIQDNLDEYANGDAEPACGASEGNENDLGT